MEHTGIVSSLPHSWGLAGHTAWGLSQRGSACGAQSPADESREAPGALQTPQHSSSLLLTTEGSSGLLPPGQKQPWSLLNSPV